MRRTLRPVLDRFRSTQLRDGSLYDSTRAVVPFAALALVWFRLVYWTPDPKLGLLLDRQETVRHVLIAVSVATLWNLWLRLSPYERESPRQDFFAECNRLTTSSIACGALILGWELLRRPMAHALPIAAWGMIGFLFTSYFCLSAFVLATSLSPRLRHKRAAVVIGTGRRAELLKASLVSQYSPIELFGCVDDENLTDADGALGGSTYLGPISNLPEILKTHPIELVLICLPIRSKYDDIQRVIDICETVGVESHYMRTIFTTARARVQAHSQVPHDFSIISSFPPDPMQHVKRLLDLIGASVILLLASPIMIATAIAVRFTSQGPVLFIQHRYGKNRKRFPMFKFRSMVSDAEKRQADLETLNEAQGPVFKLKRDPRVTRVGAFIRKTSIDELPQLFNVLRGEMSLVGPRPLPHRDVSKFEEPWLLRRFSVRPGLTCIWQVNGRSNTSFDDWMRQDLAYIDQWSISLDLHILFRTVPAVLKGSGAV